MENALYIISGLWFLIAPLESSIPLQTISYWYAVSSNNSSVVLACSKASIPPCGIENGLWLKSIFPVSSFNS